MARASNEKTAARAELQRGRILDAAYSCFVEMGFHAAGMAAVSERADMSPGLIYRYFPGGKAEIIQAIIDDQLQCAEEQIASMQAGDHVAAFLACLERREVDRRRMNFPLMLELSALASRDSAIASSVSTFDSRLRTALTAWIASHTRATCGAALSPAEAAARALMFQFLFEGIALRVVREPDIDRPTAEAAIAQLLRAVTAPPSSDPPSDEERQDASTPSRSR